MAVDGLKRCSGCQETKPLDGFSANRAAPDGKCNYCRLCEEICPTKPKAVHHTKEYELTFTDRNDFLVKWVPEVPQPQGSDPGQVWSKFLSKLGNPPTATAQPPQAKTPEAKDAAAAPPPPAA